MTWRKRIAQLNNGYKTSRNGQMQPWQRISALVLLGGMMLLSCVSADGNLHFSREDRSRAALLSLQLQARTGLAAVAELSRREETRAEAQNPSIIGYSAGGLPIESYAFGAGPNRVVLVGGIHGGAEWNTIVLAYTAIDYFSRHADRIPEGMTVQIIPAANPDGLRLVTGGRGRFLPQAVGPVTAESRFNSNGVDLNRNWDCAWQASAWWGATETSGGRAPFSEPETRALRDFFLGKGTTGNHVQAVIFWHSAVPGVFAGGCDGIYPIAERLATVYAKAARYPHGHSFDYYPITGDATNWLSRQNIPAIIVELATRDDPEWLQNLAGVLAALDYVAGRDEVAVDEATDGLPHERRLSP